jgi:hypothetical protein
MGFQKWHWLENRWGREDKGKDSRRDAEVEKEEMIEDADHVIKWEWLLFVRHNKSEDIDNVFNFMENIWKSQGEKEKNSRLSVEH